MSEVRVVITGVGAVTPIGNDAPTAFRAAINGQSGIGPLDLAFHADSRVRIGGAVKDFDADALFGKKAARRVARFIHLVLSAAREALQDTGLRDAGYPDERVGCVLGVGMGGLDVIAQELVAYERGGPRLGSPYGLPAAIPNMAAGMVAIEAHATGPCFTISSACASSAHAIGEAKAIVERGDADVMITGGVEASLIRHGLAAFERIGALSKRSCPPDQASCPFDRKRDGFVMSEGAAVLVLENYEHAKRRGARIYAELAGYGCSADAFHATLPVANGSGMARAMSLALASARTSPADVDYINAHGTATPANDVAETTAVKTVFGSCAKDVWLSSTKSMVGHMLGGAAAFETVVTALALAQGVIPPTINLDDPDPTCDLDYVPNHAREKRIRAALNNSFGFGGQNAALLMRRI